VKCRQEFGNSGEIRHTLQLATTQLETQIQSTAQINQMNGPNQTQNSLPSKPTKQKPVHVIILLNMQILLMNASRRRMKSERRGLLVVVPAVSLAILSISVVPPEVSIGHVCEREWIHIL
jgi:hypothetical protein